MHFNSAIDSSFLNDIIISELCCIDIFVVAVDNDIVVVVVVVNDVNSFAVTAVVDSVYVVAGVVVALASDINFVDYDCYYCCCFCCFIVVVGVAIVNDVADDDGTTFMTMVMMMIKKGRSRRKRGGGKVVEFQYIGQTPHTFQGC